MKSVRLHVVDQPEWDVIHAWLKDHHPDVAAWTDGGAGPAEIGAPAAFDGLTVPDGEAAVWFPPRGIGPSAWSGDDKRRTHVLRRFALLGQTLDGMRIWDVRRAIQTVRSLEGWADMPIVLEGRGRMAGVALYATLFEPPIRRLDLLELPASHRSGPDLLNVLKTLDTPATVAMAAERCEVRLMNAHADDWAYPRTIATRLAWPAQRLVIADNSPAD